MVPLTVKELNSTGKKNSKAEGAGMVRPGALNRDMSMPRPLMKEKPIDEYVPLAVPKVSKKIGQK